MEFKNFTNLRISFQRGLAYDALHQCRNRGLKWIYADHFYWKMVYKAVRQNASAFVSVADDSRWTRILAAAQIRDKKRKLRSARLRVRRKARKESA